MDILKIFEQTHFIGQKQTNRTQLYHSYRDIFIDQKGSSIARWNQSLSLAKTKEIESK